MVQSVAWVRPVRHTLKNKRAGRRLDSWCHVRKYLVALVLFVSDQSFTAHRAAASAPTMVTV
eukprot:scaffold24097_cov18-Prasinocladus_malaysianus.AAC.2